MGWPVTFFFVRQIADNGFIPFSNSFPIWGHPSKQSGLLDRFGKVMGMEVGKIANTIICGVAEPLSFLTQVNAHGLGGSSGEFWHKGVSVEVSQNRISPRGAKHATKTAQFM